MLRRQRRAAVPVAADGRTYPSRASLVRAVRSASDRQGVHAPDSRLWRLLAVAHPDWSSALLGGLVRVDVRVSDDTPRSFFRFRDGREFAIDYSRLSEGPISRARSAMRHEVRDALALFRCGRDGTIHYSSTMPFARIMEGFLRVEELVTDEDAVKRLRYRLARDRDVSELADRALARRWRDWHADRADLLLIPTSAASTA